MDFQLTLPPLLRRAETYFSQQEIVTRLPDKSFHRYTVGESVRRSKQLAVALQNLGLEPGDRVATLAWNHYQHHECYLGIPCGGFVLHTLNLRLHPTDLAYIATHAGDKAVIVDRVPAPAARAVQGRHADRARDRRRGRLRGAARIGRPGRLAGPRARRERGCGHVLHERHDRHAEGRRLLAPVDDPPHARRRLGRSARPLAVAGRHVPPRRADVPRERLGLPVPRDDARREARLPRPPPRRREPARRLRAGAGDVDGRRADDLARHPRPARCEPRQVGPRRAQGNALRRIGAAARDDRRLQAPRPRRRPRLGHDGDVAGRLDLGPDRRPEGRRLADAARLHRAAGHRAPVRRAPRQGRRRQRDPVGRRGDGRARDPRAVGGVRATTTRRSRQTVGRTTAGSRRATSSPCIRAASSGSRTGRRT